MEIKSIEGFVNSCREAKIMKVKFIRMKMITVVVIMN